MKEQIVRLEGDIKNKDNEIESLTHEITNKNTQIESMRGEIEGLQHTVLEQTAEIDSWQAASIDISFSYEPFIGIMDSYHTFEYTTRDSRCLIATATWGENVCALTFQLAEKTTSQQYSIPVQANATFTYRVESTSSIKGKTSGSHYDCWWPGNPSEKSWVAQAFSPVVIVQHEVESTYLIRFFDQSQGAAALLHVHADPADQSFWMWQDKI